MLLPPPAELCTLQQHLTGSTGSQLYASSFLPQARRKGKHRQHWHMPRRARPTHVHMSRTVRTRPQDKPITRPTRIAPLTIGIAPVGKRSGTCGCHLPGSAHAEQTSEVVPNLSRQEATAAARPALLGLSRLQIASNYRPREPVNPARTRRKEEKGQDEGEKHARVNSEGQI